MVKGVSEVVADSDKAQAEELAQYKGVVVPGAVKKGMEDAGAKSADLWKVPVDEIWVEPGFNVRIRNEELAAHIRQLADSIKANGFFQHSPLAGYVKKDGKKDVVMVTDGHCRLEAVRLANAEGAEVTELPVVVSPRGTSLEDLTAALASKAAGKRLSQLERGVVVKRLLAFGWEEKRIAERTGMSLKEIDSCMLLMAAPAVIREMVATGEVAATVAVAEMREKGSGAVESLSKMREKAVKKGHVKVTSRHRDGAALNRIVKREGSGMLELIRSVRADAGFDVVSPELKTKIDELLQRVTAELAKAEEQSKSTTDGSATASGVGAAGSAEKQNAEEVAEA